MRNAICLIGLGIILSGCVPVASTLIGVGSTMGTVGGMRTANLPDTAECREYMRFVRVAGAPGTHSPLIEKYNACLNSAPNSAAAQRYRCAPGTYISYIYNVPRCVQR